VWDLQKKLNARFDMVDLGLVKHFLGMMVSRDERGQKIYITQEGYIGHVLERFGMSNCKPVATPMDRNKPHEMVEGGEACDKTLYQQLIGSLGWIAIRTRPDISFAVSYLGRFGANPSQQHWTCAKRILRYLAGTKGLRLCLRGDLPSPIPLNGFVDADFAADAGTLKLTTGYVLLMGSAVIQWHLKLQSITATSTADAEFIACAMAIQELIWFRHLVSDITASTLALCILYNDN